MKERTGQVQEEPPSDLAAFRLSDEPIFISREEGILLFVMFVISFAELSARYEAIVGGKIIEETIVVGTLSVL